MKETKPKKQLFSNTCMVDVNKTLAVTFDSRCSGHTPLFPCDMPFSKETVTRFEYGNLTADIFLFCSKR